MSVSALQDHLSTGATHLCHCWVLARRDGMTLGFTDHDQVLEFDGVTFMPQCGLSARALSSATGLSVDNSEAAGVLSADAITEADIDAGRYDGATVSTWLVQWDNPDIRQLRFSGTLGEITRASGAFQAELRGLSDPMNQPLGRSYLTTCSAVVGDTACTVDLRDPAFSVVTDVRSVKESQFFEFDGLTAFHEKWFAGGVIEILSGQAAGLSGLIREDTGNAGLRMIRLWQQIRAFVAVGDTVRLTTGCDKRAQTCKVKFANLVNFQGFPEIPGDDWLVSVPRSDQPNFGGRRNG